GEAWEEEREHLYPLPPSDFECCDMTTVRLNHYSQAQFETNRYSVPVNQARRTVTPRRIRSTLRFGMKASCWPAIPARIPASRMCLTLCTICPCFSKSLARLTLRSRFGAGGKSGHHSTMCSWAGCEKPGRMGEAFVISSVF